MTDELGGFVPVDGAAVRALEEATRTLEGARGELASATDALLELAEDMKIEAVRRLSERGASAAQLERYEDAWREAAARVREGTSALARECGRVREAATSLR